jgi:hypothetical protein
MIQVARAQHPGVRYRVCDMRELRSAFAGRTFDLIMISFNGLDYVGHDERGSVLRAVFNLLSERGRLLFSSHRWNHAGVPGRFRPARVVWTWNPLRLGVHGARAALQTARGLQHYVARRHQRRVGRGYAILNDEAHDYRLMTYYIEPEQQSRDLREIGFQGKLQILHPFQPYSKALNEAPWLYYAVTKRPARGAG